MDRLAKLQVDVALLKNQRDKLEVENVALKQADKDHLSARQGLEQRLGQLQAKLEGLEKRILLIRTNRNKFFDENIQLQAENKQLNNQKKYIYKKEIVELQTKNERLKTAFRKYATHDPDCHKISVIGSDNNCTCGFEQAPKG